MVASMENVTPAKRALAALDKPASDAVGGRKRISKKVTAAIDLLVCEDCKNITAAAEPVGLARESLSRALNSPHITEHMRAKVLRNLALASARAGDTKLKLLDSPNEMVRDRASSFILGLAGISPETAPAAPRKGQQMAGLQIVLIERSGAETIVAGPQPITIDREPAEVRSEA
jgi:hypothetical protein